MAAIFQTTFSSAFSWMKMFEFRFIYHWSLFPRAQFTIFQHWFRLWLAVGEATSHYLNQWCSVYWCIYASLSLNEFSISPWSLSDKIVKDWQVHGWVTVTTNRSYHQPRWRRPKTVRPNNRGYQENLTVRCAHMTLTCRCHITLCISAMTMCFNSAGSENLHLEIFRKLVVTVRPCWS